MPHDNPTIESSTPIALSIDGRRVLVLQTYRYPKGTYDRLRVDPRAAWPDLEPSSLPRRGLGDHWLEPAA